jgi:hypothetical protein
MDGRIYFYLGKKNRKLLSSAAAGSASFPSDVVPLVVTALATTGAPRLHEPEIMIIFR